MNSQNVLHCVAFVIMGLLAMMVQSEYATCCYPTLTPGNGGKTRCGAQFERGLCKQGSYTGCMSEYNNIVVCVDENGYISKTDYPTQCPQSSIMFCPDDYYGSSNALASSKFKKVANVEGVSNIVKQKVATNTVAPAPK